MASIQFQYKNAIPGLASTLTIATGVNDLEWTYRLNTQVYPTFGGEVVQILSCFIDDITIGGQVSSYQALEQIYAFFTNFIANATQTGGFADNEIVMTYAKRNWTFNIIPKTLPAFRYGRDVVAPEWAITAAVMEDDGGLDAQGLIDIKQFTIDKATQKEFNISDFGKLKDGVGYIPKDPFQGNWSTKDTNTQIDAENNLLGQLIGNWTNYNYGDLTQGNVSGPPKTSGAAAAAVASAVKSAGTLAQQAGAKLQQTKPSSPTPNPNP